MRLDQQDTQCISTNRTRNASDRTRCLRYASASGDFLAADADDQMTHFQDADC